MNLAYRIRPQTLKEFVGQEQITGENKFINQMLKSGNLVSLIFWGPPGVGKTTLAFLIAKNLNAKFYEFSGVTASKDDLRKIIDKVKGESIHGKVKKIDKKINPSPSTLNPKSTILFIDEIHRWNKAQQDALLPYVESGLITLIGATTENPSFSINSALLSRCRVLVLKSLAVDDLNKLIDHALTDKNIGLGKYKKTLNNDARELLIRLSGGDARTMLNALEIAVTNYKPSTINRELISDIFQSKSGSLYDKKGEEHYNTISAFIKSMRGSSVDGALYYLARMLNAGEDPVFIARRMIIFASEDIGLADRGALIQANAGFEAVHKVGLPEAQLILAHICVYLCLAKKSRATTNALNEAMQAASDYPNEPIPLHLRNAPTNLMKDLGYAKNYKWSKTYVGPEENLSFLPEKLKDKKFWE